MSSGPQSPGDGTYRTRGGGLDRVHSGVGGRGLVRPRRGRVLAGVAAGLAQRFGISPWAVRALFIVSLLLPGPQFVAYLVLWVAMPSEP